MRIFLKSHICFRVGMFSAAHVGRAKTLVAALEGFHNALRPVSSSCPCFAEHENRRWVGFFHTGVQKSGSPIVVHDEPLEETMCPSRYDLWIFSVCPLVILS